MSLKGAVSSDESTPGPLAGIIEGKNQLGALSISVTASVGRATSNSLKAGPVRRLVKWFASNFSSEDPVKLVITGRDENDQAYELDFFRGQLEHIAFVDPAGAHGRVTYLQRRDVLIEAFKRHREKLFSYYDE